MIQETSTDTIVLYIENNILKFIDTEKIVDLFSEKKIDS